MSGNDNAEIMLAIFEAIEQRDLQQVLDRCDPEVEFHWPPSFPYGGTSRGLAGEHPTWAETWSPLQPGAAERSMDPRVIAASDDEVVILWRQRGVSPRGDRCDSPVLALYKLRDGKLVRAQMFYFDPVTVGRFLAGARGAAA